MIDGKTVIAIIPARGGSKGLPGKNIRPLCGKPLIAWSIEQALQSKYVDVVCVTTDSPEIADISRSFGADVPFLRPAELASDVATSFDTISHALSYYEDTVDSRFEYTVMLEPTSPLRDPGDIDNMLEKLNNNKEAFDGIIGIGEVFHHPSILKKCEGEKLLSVFPGQHAGRRQDLETVYWPFGTFVTKTNALLSEKTFYPSYLSFYILKRYQCYEIDDLYDFICVEAMMKHEWKLM